MEVNMIKIKQKELKLLKHLISKTCDNSIIHMDMDSFPSVLCLYSLQVEN